MNKTELEDVVRGENWYLNSDDDIGEGVHRIEVCRLTPEKKLQTVKFFASDPTLLRNDLRREVAKWTRKTEQDSKK